MIGDPSYKIMKESFLYRSRKWVCQQLTSPRRADQLDRIVTEEWDVLLILDACRFDILRHIANWPISSVTSPGSCTSEWLKAAHAAGVFREPKIITANPQYEKVGVEFPDERIHHSWDTDWDPELRTTPPEPVLDRVTAALDNETTPVIAHLEQPHWPYIVKLGDSWVPAYPDLGPWTVDGREIYSVQVAFERGVLDISLAKQAYEASVRSIWELLREYVASWVADGSSIVVTADHGETFGRLSDLGFYEHPCGCHVDPLTSVPWVEFRLPEGSDTDEDTVKARLRALGYT